MTGWARVVVLFRNSRPPEVGPENRFRVLAALPRLASEAMPRKPLFRYTSPAKELEAFVKLKPLVPLKLANSTNGVVSPVGELSTPPRVTREFWALFSNGLN